MAEPHPRRGPLSTIKGWMILIAAIALAVALIREVPGVAILLMATVVPALAVTELVAYRRRRRGEPMSREQKMVWVFALSIQIPVFLVLAVAIALYVYCSIP